MSCYPYFAFHNKNKPPLQAGTVKQNLGIGDCPIGKILWLTRSTKKIETLKQIVQIKYFI